MFFERPTNKVVLMNQKNGKLLENLCISYWCYDNMVCKISNSLVNYKIEVMVIIQRSSKRVTSFIL